MLTSIHHWFVNPERNLALVLIPIGLVSILIGIALLVATTAVYILGRNRMRTSGGGFFVGARRRLNALGMSSAGMAYRPGSSVTPRVSGRAADDAPAGFRPSCNPK